MNTVSIRSCSFCVLAAVTLSLVGAARAAAPAGRYTYTAASVTVYDTKTRLTWQRTAAAAMTQAAGKTYCASTSTSASLGGAGWRLPTVKELLTLVDFSLATGPVIDQAAFPSTPSAVFWSSTPQAGASSMAWVVSFIAGPTIADNVSVAYAVRCVR